MPLLSRVGARYGQRAHDRFGDRHEGPVERQLHRGADQQRDAGVLTPERQRGRR